MEEEIRRVFKKNLKDILENLWAQAYVSDWLVLREELKFKKKTKILLLKKLALYG